MRDLAFGSNLGGGMSSSGGHKLLWCINHTFEFECCGSPATAPRMSVNAWSVIHQLKPSNTITYGSFFTVSKHGRSFAELGVAPPVRLERP